MTSQQSPTQKRRQIWAGEIQPTFCIISTTVGCMSALGWRGEEKKNIRTWQKNVVRRVSIQCHDAEWSAWHLCKAVSLIYDRRAIVINLLWGNSSYMDDFAIMRQPWKQTTSIPCHFRIRLHFPTEEWTSNSATCSVPFSRFTIGRLLAPSSPSRRLKRETRGKERHVRQQCIYSDAYTVMSMQL